MNETILGRYLVGEHLTEEEMRELTAYRQKCITHNLEHGNSYHGSEFSPHFESLIKKAAKKNGIDLEQRLKMKKVIELGPGGSPLAKDFLDLGVSGYFGVEPFVPDLTKQMLPKDHRVSLVPEDGLTYLLKQPDNSAIVVSFGAVCVELGGPISSLEDIRGNLEYLAFLAREMFRVTLKGEIMISVPSSKYTDELFEDVGFRNVFGKMLWTK